MRIPANTSIPISLHDLARNLADARELLDLGPLRSRSTSEIVNRSTLVLVCASFEAFLEDLALDALSFIVKHRVPADDLSPKTRTLLKRTIAKLDQKLLPYGTGLYMRTNRDRFLGAFSTPTSRKIDRLFDGLFGIPKLTSSWSWNRVTSSGARTRLDHYVTLRCDIAHRARTPGNVTKAQVNSFIELCGRLSWLSCNSLRHWLVSETGREPWARLPPFAVTVISTLKCNVALGSG
jgi:hypothetical protein